MAPRDHRSAIPIAGKVFFAFCLILLVVLGLGLWTLHATRRLHEVNQALLGRGLPAVRLQRALAEDTSVLIRHETRAIVLGDPTYRTLHQERVEKFREHLQTLTGVIDGPETRAALEQVESRLADYLRLVDQEWAALERGLPDAARRLAEGPSRTALRALDVAVEAFLAHSLADLERMVGAAGGLQRSAQTATILSLAVGLAVGLGAAAMVAQRVARPIRALSRATRLVARGEYDLPIPASSRDEVGDLARAFQDMAQTLRQLDELKEEFFARISHDFCSPLTSIQLAARLLRADPLTAQQQRWMTNISAATDKLLRLTHQILELSKLRSGALRLELARTELRQVVDSATLEVQPLSVEKGVALSVTLPVPSPELTCDEGRLQQVLANLLSNAVKFTPAGGKVHVAGREEGAEVVLVVEDTGVGIPAAQLPHVFEPYRQAHRGNGGTGLGLAIVKGFVEAHGGRVWVDSREGQGSRFQIVLPREGPRR